MGRPISSCRDPAPWCGVGGLLFVQVRTCEQRSGERGVPAGSCRSAAGHSPRGITCREAKASGQRGIYATTTTVLNLRARARSAFPPVATEGGTSRNSTRHERTHSNLAAEGANSRGRNAAFPSLRPVLADQCRSPQGCLPTMRVQLRGCSSAQGFRAHSRWYRSCGYRDALQVPARDAPSFAGSSFS